jgi:hypothetical protein
MYDRSLAKPPFHSEFPVRLSLWHRLGPALSAALLISWLLVLQEIMSDVLPFFGSLVTLPLWMFTYYLQGLLVGYLARRDPRTRDDSHLQVLGLGVVSAFWSGVVISAIISLVGLAASTLLTAGAAAMTIPLMIPGTILDIFLNLVFTTLGAGIFARRQGQHIGSISCTIGILMVVTYCMVVAIFIVVLAAGGFQFLQPYFQNFHFPSFQIGP